MKRILTILFTLLAASSVLLSCGGGSQTADKADFIVNNGAEPQSLDPSHIQGNVEHRVFMALFEGLVIYDPVTSRALPGVAESWTVSPDGATLTFKLRNTAKWSNGDPVVAQDFVDGWLRTLDPATGSEYAYMVGMVVKGANEFNSFAADKNKSDADNKTAEDALRAAVAVKAVDDHTLEVGLVGPVPYAIDMMAHYSFAPLPMKAITKYGDSWTKPENFVCNGPYTLKEWKPQQYIFVVKNNKYWDAKNVKLRSIKFLPIDDLKTSYNMFKNGEIDWDTTVPNDLLDEVKLRKDYQVSPQVSTYYYIFNVTKKPLTDVRVRKALAMAIDKQTLVDKILKGGQLIADSLVPAMEGYTPAKGNAFNVDAAKKLLAEAGFPNGKGFPKLTILYNTNDNHKKIAEFVQDQWKQNLGIDVALQNQEWKTFLDTRSNSHDFQIARAGWIGDYLDPNTYLDMFLSNSGNNDGRYNSAKYDELVKKAMTMPAGADRFAALSQAENTFITEDQGVAPFYFYVSQNLIDTNKWAGWTANPLDAHEWKFVSKK
jgi:oligopeptide transport system substrate-binding protein